jgi:hypothetical protein
MTLIEDLKIWSSIYQTRYDEKWQIVPGSNREPPLSKSGALTG